MLFRSRSPARGLELASLLHAKLPVRTEFVEWRDTYPVPPATDILVHATSVGLYEPEARVAVHLDSLRPGMVVADVIFSPPRTRLIRDAEARGCRTIDGLGMIVNQGVVSIEYWTGTSPDPAVMRHAVEKALELSASR